MDTLPAREYTEAELQDLERRMKRTEVKEDFSALREVRRFLAPPPPPRSDWRARQDWERRFPTRAARLDDAEPLELPRVRVPPLSVRSVTPVVLVIIGLVLLSASLSRPSALVFFSGLCLLGVGMVGTALVLFLASTGRGPRDPPR